MTSKSCGFGLKAHTHKKACNGKTKKKARKEEITQEEQQQPELRLTGSRCFEGFIFHVEAIHTSFTSTSEIEKHKYIYINILFLEREREKDVGILSDLATSNDRNGDAHTQVLRRTRRASSRPLRRRLRLVRLSLHHHPCSSRHLDGTYLFHSLPFPSN